MVVERRITLLTDMATKKKQGIDPVLEKAIAKLLIEVMQDTTATITDKMKVIDRSLKLEAIKLKMSNDDWGAGLFGEDDDKGDE